MLPVSAKPSSGCIFLACPPSRYQAIDLPLCYTPLDPSWSVSSRQTQRASEHYSIGE